MLGADTSWTVGGIFFDDMMDRPAEELLAFSADCIHSVGASYLPIVEKRHAHKYTDAHKAWQQLRRGRYVEFNLVRLSRCILHPEHSAQLRLPWGTDACPEGLAAAAAGAPSGAQGMMQSCCWER